MAGTLLPLPDDPRFQAWIDEWPAVAARGWKRSAWLGIFEGYLREYYPFASSRDRSLTARHYAPFPLLAGHDVP